MTTNYFKIAIFSFDAGGCEILSELIKSNLHIANFKYFYIKNSPTHNILAKKGLLNISLNTMEYNILKKLEEFQPNLVLYGTGWQNHIEYIFLDYAKKQHIVSVAFLDNWTNYRERFGYPNKFWKNNFPTFIATFDKTSEELAKKLGLTNIIKLKNYWLNNQIKKFKKNSNENNLLILSEPTSKVAKKTFNNPNYWGFSEYSYVKDIINNFDKFNCKHIILRLHPSDNPKKYKMHGIKISKNNLKDDIHNAKVIIGIDSSILYLAYNLGKKTLSYIPSKNRKFHVPLPMENRFRDLKKLNLENIKIGKGNIYDKGIEFAYFLKKMVNKNAKNLK